MIKVCILTSVHSPFDTRIFHKEAKSLVKAGYDVTIVAQHDKEEIIDGIRIVPLPRPKNRFERMTRTAWYVYKKALQINAKVYHFHDPELIPIGLMLKRKNKVVIYDVHEVISAQIKIKHWISPIFRPFISKLFTNLENLSAKAFDAILVPQPSMQKRFRRLNKNSIFVANYVKKDFYTFNDFDLKRKHILYTGVLSKERGLINMLNAMEYVNGEHMLYLAGLFPNKSIKELAQKNKRWSSVKYFGFLNHAKLSELHKECLIGLVLYENIAQYYMTNALKLFEFMISEMPVIMPDFGDWLDFNKENKCGICVNVRNYKEIGDAINYLFDNPNETKKLGKNGRKAVQQKYNWGVSEKELIKIYQSVLG